MAFQTPVVRRVAGIAVSSTFSTGMLTRLGHAIGSLRDPPRRSHELTVVRVLGGSVLAFLSGAVIGGALLDPLGNATMVVPFLGLAVVTVWQVRVGSGPAARPDG